MIKRFATGLILGFATNLILNYYVNSVIMESIAECGIDLILAIVSLIGETKNG